MPDNKISLKPVLVLVVICVVIAGLLAGVNAITAPIIEARNQAELTAMLSRFFPDATGFTELSVDIPGVSAAYKENSGQGYAFVTVGKGYKGDVTVTTALDPDGAVIIISVDASGESATIGDRVALPAFTDLFQGLTESADTVTVVSGATTSSRAVKSAVNLAFAAYQSVKEGGQ